MILYDGLNNLTWFMGLVEAVGDKDDTHNGRVKVRAFGFHPTVEENTVDTPDLPWAMVLGVSPHIHVPLDIGELVFGAFLDGRDAQIPLIFGTIPIAKFGIPVTAGQGGGAAQSGQVGSSAIAANYSASTPQEAFLNAIAVKESGGNYNILNGGQIVPDLTSSPHPNMVGTNGQSTAAGKYQFTYGTWLDLNNGINAPMTPENQDAAAWKLAQQRYSAYTGGNDLNSYIETNGVTPDLLNTLSPTWAAFGVPSNQSEIINVYNTSLANAAISGPAGMPVTNLMLKNSAEVINNFGNKALPPQATGEDIHKTPVAAATTNAKNYNSNGYSVNHPGVPLGGSYKTGVWNTRYDGSYIEMHAGASKEDEHINIMHRSGSHITLDQNGNITISSTGRVHIASTNNLEEHIDGYTTNVSKGGYSILVDGGSLNLTSTGDLNIVSNSNINLRAGGNIWMTAGGAAGISAPKIGMTAEAGIISMLAGQNIALQSSGDITNKAKNMVLNASGKLGIKTDGDLTVKGDNLVVDAGGNLGIQSAGDLIVKGDTLSLASSGDLKQKGGSGIILDGGWVGIKSNSTTTIDSGGIAYIKGSQVHLNDGGSVGSVSAPEIDVPDIITVPDTGGAVKPEGPAGSPPPMGVGGGKSSKLNTPTPGSISITDIDDIGPQ